MAAVAMLSLPLSTPTTTLMSIQFIYQGLSTGIFLHRKNYSS